MTVLSQPISGQDTNKANEKYNCIFAYIINHIMTKKESIKLFEEKKVRTVWDEEQEKWYFSIVDVVGILAESKDYQTARKYWNKLKQRLKEEGFEPVTNCHQLKLRAEDGKMRMTDVADTEQLFRIIQSIPSPKAEPFKQWRTTNDWDILTI